MTSRADTSASRQWRRVRAVAEEALDLSAAEQEALLAERCGDDPELARAVRRLLELDRDHEPEATLFPHRERSAGAPSAPPYERIGPYVLRRRIGAGGMGSVWLAVQAEGDFHRRVAIKLLHEGAAREEILARFHRERQVLANLDHPGIARLIDGGVSDRGEPYLVMEYVEGSRIDRWCDEQRLTVRARLELFRKVCEAVQHAHQRLVVHRDLKPGNILVASDGTPKLLDFGIARVLDPEKQAFGAEVTQGVMRFFTPAYASPEQIRGQPVTTASDVYSLGVLLHQLLTGRLPHRVETTTPAAGARVSGDAEPLKPSAAVVAPRQPSGPREGDERSSDPAVAAGLRSTTTRQLSRALAGDLDRIVLKALRPEPLRRYSTVHELSEDVHRYLHALPVAARPDSAMYRASRFVRRNRLAVTLASLLFLSLCAGLFVVQEGRVEERSLRELAETRLLDVQRISGELERRNEELRAQGGELELRIREAGELAAGLESARALAESRFADIRRFTTTLLFDLYARVYSLEGATDATGILLQTGIEYLDRLARESEGNPELRRELAAAYMQLANQQAGLYYANMALVDDAEQSIEKAAACLRGLSPEGAPAPQDRMVLAQIEIARGDVGRRRMRNDEALGAYTRAIELCAPAEHDSAAPARDRYALGTAISRLAEWHYESGHLDEAEAAYARSQAVLEELLHSHPAQPAYLNDLSITYGRRGAILASRGDTGPGIALAYQSMEQAEALARAYPDNYFYARQSAHASFQLAELLEANGEIEEARNQFQLARETTERLAAADPKNILAQRDFVVIHSHAAGFELRAGEWDRAVAQGEHALPAAKQRAERDAHDWLAQVELAQLHLDVGRAKHALGMNLEAGADLGQTSAILERLWEPDRTEAPLCRYYAQTSQTLGSTLRSHAQSAQNPAETARGLDTARTWLDRASTLFQRLVDDGRALPTDATDLLHVRDELDHCATAQAALAAGTGHD